ncbi:unnamed protein product, partial [Symbiodinium necroappetens]
MARRKASALMAAVVLALLASYSPCLFTARQLPEDELPSGSLGFVNFLGELWRAAADGLFSLL